MTKYAPFIIELSKEWSDEVGVGSVVVPKDGGVLMVVIDKQSNEALAIPAAASNGLYEIFQPKWKKGILKGEKSVASGSWDPVAKGHSTYINYNRYSA